MRNNLGEEIRGLPNELRDELRLVTADEAGEMRFVLQEACEEEDTCISSVCVYRHEEKRRE